MRVERSEFGSVVARAALCFQNLVVVRRSAVSVLGNRTRWHVSAFTFVAASGMNWLASTSLLVGTKQKTDGNYRVFLWLGPFPTHD